MYSSDEEEEEYRQKADVAGKQAKLKIFGRTEGLSKIQFLYSCAWRYRCEILSKGSQTTKGSKLTNCFFIRALKDLEWAIYDKMPISTSPEYNRYIAMKGISYNMWNHVDLLVSLDYIPRDLLESIVNNEFIKKALVLLDPIKLTPEGIGAYLQTVFDISEAKSEEQNAIMHLHNAFSAIDVFEKSGKKVLAEEEIFGGNAPKSFEGGSKWLNEQRHRFSVKLFNAYALMKNEKIMKKFIIPAIQEIFFKEKAALVEQLVPTLWGYVNYLVDFRHFEQVNHLVSFLTFHLVKAGRSAELTITKQKEINGAKALASYWYAHWADEILRYTYLMVTNPEDSDVLTNPISTKVVRFEDYVVPGVEKYENLFPVDAIKSARKWQKVIKKGKIWCQRSIDYIQKSEEDCALNEDKGAHKLMKSFLEWEKKNIF